MAARSTPSQPVRLLRSTAADATPQVESLLRRHVPLTWLIAAAVAALVVGFCFGLMVKISYPDGTVAQIEVPAGSHVTLVPAENGSPEDSAEDETAASPAAAIDAKPSFASEPLCFAILDDRDHNLPQKSANGDAPIVTDDVTWYPLAANLADRNSEVGADERFAPVANDVGSRIPWTAIRGHLRVQRSYGLPSKLELDFDAELAATMERLTAANQNRRLAIILNNRVISAPVIKGKIGRRAMLDGLTHEEAQALMELNAQDPGDSPRKSERSQSHAHGPAADHPRETPAWCVAGHEYAQRRARDSRTGDNAVCVPRRPLLSDRWNSIPSQWHVHSGQPGRVRSHCNRFSPVNSER